MARRRKLRAVGNALENLSGILQMLLQNRLIEQRQEKLSGLAADRQRDLDTMIADRQRDLSKQNFEQKLFETGISAPPNVRALLAKRTGLFPMPSEEELVAPLLEKFRTSSLSQQPTDAEAMLQFAGGGVNTTPQLGKQFVPGSDDMLPSTQFGPTSPPTAGAALDAVRARRDLLLGEDQRVRDQEMQKLAETQRLQLQNAPQSFVEDTPQGPRHRFEAFGDVQGTRIPARELPTPLMGVATTQGGASGTQFLDPRGIAPGTFIPAQVPQSVRDNLTKLEDALGASFEVEDASGRMPGRTGPVRQYFERAAQLAIPDPDVEHLFSQLDKLQNLAANRFGGLVLPEQELDRIMRETPTTGLQFERLTVRNRNFQIAVLKNINEARQQLGLAPLDLTSAKLLYLRNKGVLTGAPRPQ